MYLTRIKLNVAKQKTLRFLASLQVAHATIEAMFDGQEKCRKLWRLDYFQGKPCILVLSPEKPDVTGMIHQVGFEGVPWEIKDCSALLDHLQKGQLYHFRLTANPVHAVKKAGEKRGKVLPHVTAQQQKQWLLDKCSTYGFHVLEFEITERGLKKFPHKGKHLTFSRVSYEGQLQITDAEIFKKSLIQGIGREKAYGCGLLTLAP